MRIFCWGTTAPRTQTPSYLYSREGYQLWGFFAQDSWKVTRKLTLDYGVRYDYATPEHEQYGRLGQFDPTVVNPNAGELTGRLPICQHLQLRFLQVGLSLWNRAADRGGLSAQVEDGLARRMGIKLSVHCQPGRGAGGLQRRLPAFRYQPLRQHRDARRHCAAGLAGHQPDDLSDSGHGRRGAGRRHLCPTRTRTGRRASINSASAYSGRLRGISWLRHLMLPIARSGSPVALGRLSQISPQTYASYGLYPYAGTGPAGYNYTLPGDTQRADGTWSLCVPGNDCDRYAVDAVCFERRGSAKMAAAGHPNFTPYSGFPTR